jgi:hypothetical protein
MQYHAIHPAPFLPCTTPWWGEPPFKRHHLPRIRSANRHLACVGEEPPSSSSLPCPSLCFHGRGPWPSRPATPQCGGAPPLGSLQAHMGAIEASRRGGPTSSQRCARIGQPRPSLPCHATPLAWCCCVATSHGLVPYCAARRSAPTPASRCHRRRAAIVGAASASVGDSPAVAVRAIGNREKRNRLWALPTSMHRASVNPVIACDQAKEPLHTCRENVATWQLPVGPCMAVATPDLTSTIHCGHIG